MRQPARTAASLTEGSIIKALLSLSLPIMLANALQTSYQLVNTFWVGRLGADAVAAVSVSFPIIFLMVSLGGGLTMAGTVLVSQYAGARDDRAVNHVAAQTLLLVGSASLLFAVIGYLATPAILRLMRIEPAVFNDADRYMRVSFLSIVFMFGFAIFQSILRGIGEVKLPLYMVTGSVLLNIGLDPLLIFGWGPLPAGGVEGAAWATFITQAIVATIGISLLFNARHGMHLQWNGFAPNLALIKKIFALGIPASIEQSMQALGITIMTSIVASFGTLAIAAYGIGFRILTFAIIPAFGISMATSTLVGMNIGAGNGNRSERVALLSAWTGFGLLTIVGFLLFINAEMVVRFFVPETPELIREGAVALRFMAFSFGFTGAQLGLSGAFRGAGDLVFTMTLAIISIWALQIPLAWILSKHTSLGTEGLWLAYPVSGLVTTGLAIVRFKQGHWKGNHLVRRDTATHAPHTELLEEGLH